MRKFFFFLSVLLMLASCGTSHAACFPAISNVAGVPGTVDCVAVTGYVNTVGQSVPYTLTVGDPCQNPYILKSSSPVAQGASATTAIGPALVVGQKVYVCSLEVTLAGTTPTFTMVTGTGSNCASTQSNLSGAFTVVGYMQAFGSVGVLTTSVVSGQICLTTAATTSVQGIVTYVQQ